ncbi:MAG TPA: AraC family transcriptional regulator [Candidatus Methylacidiphilales bacterium]
MTAPARKENAVPPEAEILRQALRAPVALCDVKTLKFPPTYSSGAEVITTNRFVLVLDGELDYTVNGLSCRLKKGQQFFVPAWVRREWHPRPRMHCELIWCEFFSQAAQGGDAEAASPYVRTCPRPRPEEEALRRMTALWPGFRIVNGGAGDASGGALPLGTQLRLEGELKALLARFWSEAQPWGAGDDDSRACVLTLHAEVKKALLYLNQHHRRPDALRELYRRLKLSPNHFRLLFHREIGCSPQDHLLRVRMRQARHLVLGSDIPLKEIAMAVGFSDPLFFSRQFRHFFGASPSSYRR